MSWPTTCQTQKSRSDSQPHSEADLTLAGQSKQSDVYFISRLAGEPARRVERRAGSPAKRIHSVQAVRAGFGGLGLGLLLDGLDDARQRAGRALEGAGEVARGARGSGRPVGRSPPRGWAACWPAPCPCRRRRPRRRRRRHAESRASRRSSSLPAASGRRWRWRCDWP